MNKICIYTHPEDPVPAFMSRRTAVKSLLLRDFMKLNPTGRFCAESSHGLFLDRTGEGLNGIPVPEASLLFQRYYLWKKSSGASGGGLSRFGVPWNFVGRREQWRIVSAGGVAAVPQLIPEKKTDSDPGIRPLYDDDLYDWSGSGRTDQPAAYFKKPQGEPLILCHAGELSLGFSPADPEKHVSPCQNLVDRAAGVRKMFSADICETLWFMHEDEYVFGMLSNFPWESSRCNALEVLLEKRYSDEVLH